MMTRRSLMVEVDTSLEGPALDAALLAGAEATARVMLGLSAVRSIQVTLENPEAPDTQVRPSVSSSSRMEPPPE